MALTPEERTKISDYFQAYAPLYLQQATYTFMVDDAAESLSASFFGSNYCKAVAFLAMHNMAIASQVSNGSGGTEGYIIQRTIGPITVKYASPTSSDKRRDALSLFKTTKYGLMLLDLYNTCGGNSAISVNHNWGLID